MTETLKPCPFCGGEGVFLRTAVDGSAHIVGCANCPCCIGIQGEGEANAAWNTRAPDDVAKIMAWLRGEAAAFKTEAARQKKPVGPLAKAYNLSADAIERDLHATFDRPMSYYASSPC